MKRKIKFIANVVKWLDRVNGNTYHSVRVIRCRDSKTVCSQFEYGYGNHYEQTTLDILSTNKMIPVKYRTDKQWQYQRENNYPIHYNVSYGLKRECLANIAE